MPSFHAFHGVLDLPLQLVGLDCLLRHFISVAGLILLSHFFIMLDTQRDLLCFNRGLLYLRPHLSLSLITQEFVENAAHRLQLDPSHVFKCSFEQFFFVDLLVHVGLP